jgi:rhamnosyltransferase subunit B
LFPEWFSAVQPDWPENTVLTGFPLYDEGDARPPDASLDEFLDAGEPPIVFIAGSTNVHAREFFRVSTEVCRTGKRRGLFLTTYQEQLPVRLPEGVRHFHYIPLSRALPRALALVHPGGIGTVAQALSAGIPQLIVPLANDQPDNATRIHRLALGHMIRPARYTPARALDRLERMSTSPTIAQNIRQRASELARNTALQKTCQLIERTFG